MMNHFSGECPVDNLEQDGTYAGNDAIVAFARNNDVNVVIHQFNNPRFVIEGYQPMSGKNKELHLSYHNGEHYSSLRKINDPDTGPAYTFHSIEAVKKVVEPKCRNPEIRKVPEKTSVKTKCEQSSSDVIDDLTEEERRIMETTGCKNKVLIREALIDHEYDVDGALSYIMQLMCLTEDDTVTKVSSISHQDQSVDMCENEKEIEDVCSCDCSCSEGEQCNQVKKKSSQALSGNNTKPKETTHKKATHLSNRQRKELAKQEKKKRREETQRNKAKEEKVDECEQKENAGTPVPDLGAVKI